jgi:hypothetical protein
MKNVRTISAALFLFFILFNAASFSQIKLKQNAGDNYKTLIKNFQNPPSEFSTAPFWVWNEIITKKGIDEQLKAYKERGINQVILHPRPGLITTYLTDEWFGLVKYSVEKAKSLGMKVWLYDENSYPSGFAGGEVPAQLPETQGKMLQLVKTSDLSKINSEIAFILKKEGDKFIEISKAAVKEGEEYYVFVYILAGKSAWYGGYSYVDIMQRKTTDKFLEVTHEQYKKYIGNEFGKTVPGIFTDEPNIHVAGGTNSICYTPALFDYFKKRWGYDLKVNMPLLFDETGDYKKVRHNYYSALLDLLIENWAVPIHNFCERNNIALTGHYWEHDWPMPRNTSDNMALAAYSQVPGIDLLMNQWSTQTYAQFGNNRFVKELRSVANQMARARTISETYGAAGWDLTFNDMKRIGDWEYVLGINLMNQHLSYYSITGPRKRDHPNSFSYHSPYWDDYKTLADYYARLSSVMSQGVQQNKILVLQPTTTAWTYFNLYSSYNNQDPNRAKDRPFDKLASSFNDFVNSLESWQVEYDLGSEDIIKKHWDVSNEQMSVGACNYKLFVLPAMLDNLDKETVTVLEKYLVAGGKVLSTNVLPSHIDGSESNKVKLLAGQYPENWKQVSTITRQVIAAMLEPEITFNDVTPAHFVFHQRRKLVDSEVLFIVNTSKTETAKGSFTMDGGSIEVMDCFTGKYTPYTFTKNDEKLNAEFELPACGSLLLCIKPETGKSSTKKGVKESAITFTDPVKVERKTPNILTIDFCDLKIGEKTWKDLYFYQAQTETFKAVGMPKSPWDNSVQYKSTVVDKNKFPAESGFTADFNFTVDAGVDLKGLELAAERPNVFKIFVNDKPVTAVPGKWWLDKDFGVYEIGAYVKEGNNKITVKVMPMSIYAELESVYLLGNFSLVPQEKGFKITPANKMEPGAWNKQGMPLYGGKVSYSHSLNVENLKGEYFVKLGKWEGSCAEIYVNNKKAGIIAWAPDELNISKYLHKGKNYIRVEVIGTLRNTLGPHHANSNGSCWPSMFQSVQKDFTLAGASYASNPYGLMEDFKVIQKKLEGK